MLTKTLICFSRVHGFVGLNHPRLLLPTARTCTQQLRLPKYSSQHVLRLRLRKALEHKEGFGND